MSNRIKYIAGNWKMNKLSADAAELARSIVEGSKNSSAKIMIAPPFTSLSEVSKVVKGTNVILGAQNMSNALSGAHTGEISAEMLKDLGVEVVIIGHSERRSIYGETDAFINSKLKLALQSGIEVIFCVGETLDERESGRAEEIVCSQVEKGLLNITEAELVNVTIAYEPVWAIGTGKTATAEDADNIHKLIREKLAQIYSDKAASEIVIQYGGSVKPENATSLLSMENIDGALVGGASLKPELFLPIISNII